MFDLSIEIPPLQWFFNNDRHAISWAADPRDRDQNYYVNFNKWRPAIWAATEGQILFYEGRPLQIIVVDMEWPRIILRKMY